MHYFKKIESGVNTFYLSSSPVTGLFKTLRVIEYFPDPNYTVETHWILPKDCQPATKEEFDTAYDNAMNSFIKFIEENSKP
jgi:hypothetical protein